MNKGLVVNTKVSLGIASLAKVLPFRSHAERMTDRPAYNPFDPRTQYFPADSFLKDGRVGIIHTTDGETVVGRYRLPPPVVEIPKLIPQELMEMIMRGEI